jgi:hypothetical protein
LYYGETEIVEMLFRVSEKYTKDKGSLYITTYKLKFIPDRAIDTGFLSIPFGYIHVVLDKPSERKITIKTKDERCFKFSFDVMH